MGYRPVGLSRRNLNRSATGNRVAGQAISKVERCTYSLRSLLIVSAGDKELRSTEGQLAQQWEHCHPPGCTSIHSMYPQNQLLAFNLVLLDWQD